MSVVSAVGYFYCAYRALRDNASAAPVWGMLFSFCLPPFAEGAFREWARPVGEPFTEAMQGERTHLKALVVLDALHVMVTVCVRSDDGPLYLFFKLAGPCRASSEACESAGYAPTSKARCFSAYILHRGVSFFGESGPNLRSDGLKYICRIGFFTPHPGPAFVMHTLNSQ